MFAEKIQLEDDEHILIQVRKHWFVIGMQMAGVVLVALFPLFAFALLTRSPLGVYIAQIQNPTILLSFYTCWLILAWMALFSVWTNYYLDVWTITNKRLISVDQRGLFNRNTGSFRLERLQDINVNIRGIIPTFLNYGELLAETASEDRDFVARNIPKPQELKSLILKAADEITFVHNRGGQTQTAVDTMHVSDGL